jgi:hypothetical protein
VSHVLRPSNCVRPHASIEAHAHHLLSSIGSECVNCQIPKIEETGETTARVRESRKAVWGDVYRDGKDRPGRAVSQEG